MYFEVNELIDNGLEIDEYRKKSTNGTIVNNFKNNYRKYISTSIVNKLVKFLKTNQSTVFSTVWGHGGVGKTAAIQRVCEVLLNEKYKTFDYIIFVSAKDRKYNYYKGIIEHIDGGVDSYSSAIRYINNIAFCNNNSDPTSIIEFKGRMLIIIDDYETFGQDEKDKILDFIKSLNITHHKVVITTRSANYITGEEIEVEELSPKESLEFFDNVLENELSIDKNIYKKGINTDDLELEIHKQTNGRPLFIFQCAIVYGESGSISDMLKSNIKDTENAVEFLYGRILDYLSPDAKMIFGTMGALTSSEDMSNLTSKLKYILNMEKDDHRFQKAIDELIKLKVISIFDDKYFKVYSSEILNIMQESFTDNTGSITSRLQIVGNDRTLDSNLSLLDDADNSRILRKPTEVILKYRHIISRVVTPEDIKIKAIINLAQYLIEDNGNFEEGLALLKEFKHTYHNSCIFVKAYAIYMWRGDDTDKENAITLIQNLLSHNNFEDLDMTLDFLCTLMRYETTLLINTREELKDSYRLSDITEEEYKKSFDEQKKDFYRLYNYPGLELFNCIKNDTLKDYKHEFKIKLLNGLSYFIEICIRRYMYDDIDTIFTYIFNNLKYNYHDIFKIKLERINKIRRNNIKFYHEYIETGSIGDRISLLKTSSAGDNTQALLGEKLKEALSKAKVVH